MDGKGLRDHLLGGDDGRHGRAPVPSVPLPKNLPQNLEAERSVLGAILLQNEAFDLVTEVGLKSRDFYLESHRRIFETAAYLAEKRQPIDLVTLSSALRDRGWYDTVGGTETLTSLFEDAYAVGNVSHYARIVREKAVQRRMIQACSEIIGDAVAGIEDNEVFLDQAENKVFAVAGDELDNSATPLKTILLQNMASIEELALKDEEVTGLPTGFRDFDELTTGLHPGQVVIVAARPGMGKTSWFISALQHAALERQAVVALFSLEMSKDELGFRFLSGMSRIESRRLKLGKLSNRDWHGLAEAADRLSKSKIFIDDQGGLTAMDIRARCRRLKSIHKKLDLIVIDYLQLMKGPRGGKGEQSREREISEISRSLKELAKELGVPIIALSQLNRGVEMRQDKRPNLSDLRESGAIEQDADIVMFIHREDYYDKETDNRGIAEIIVAKNRSGETRTVKLAWLGQFTLFANLAPGSGPTDIAPPRVEKGDIIL